MKRTKILFASRIYSSQLSHSKLRNHPPPTYTREEFRNWLFNQIKFHELYFFWKKNNYLKNLIPSCNRTDDYKGYDLSRLELITWEKHLRQTGIDVVTGKLTKNTRAVIATNKETGRKVKHYSIREAARRTMTYTSNIQKACVGDAKSAGNWYWEYE